MKNVTILEAFSVVIKDNVSSFMNLDNFNACSFQDRAYNSDFPKCENPNTFNLKDYSTLEYDLMINAGYIEFLLEQTITVNTEYGDFPLQAHTRLARNIYGRYSVNFSTDVAIKGAIKRKQKKYPNGITLTSDMLLNSVSFSNFKKAVKENFKLLEQMEISRFLVKLSETNFVDCNKLKAIKLEKMYNKIQDNGDKLEFLANADFKGLNNFDYKSTIVDDGYGHSNVSCMSLDFVNKSCYVAYGNSGD